MPAAALHARASPAPRTVAFAAAWLSARTVHMSAGSTCARACACVPHLLAQRVRLEIRSERAEHLVVAADRTRVRLVVDEPRLARERQLLHGRVQLALRGRLRRGRACTLARWRARSRRRRACAARRPADARLCRRRGRRRWRVGPGIACAWPRRHAVRARATRRRWHRCRARWQPRRGTRLRGVRRCAARRRQLERNGGRGRQARRHRHKAQRRRRRLTLHRQQLAHRWHRCPRSGRGGGSTAATYACTPLWRARRVRRVGGSIRGHHG